MAITQVVGVDIGSGAIRAVEVSGIGSKRPSVVRFSTMPLPDGAVHAGEVLEVNTVAAALKQLWSTAKFSSKNVVLGVGNSKVLVRDFAVPKLSLAEIRESLPTHVQEMLPVPVADAILDFYPISESPSDTGPVVNGLLVAVIKESVLANVKAVQAAGLNPIGVDLIPFALTRLTSAARLVGNVAHIEIGSRTTNVIVTTGGVPQFVRTIANGGHDLTVALADRLDLSLDDAEALKRHLGLTGAAATPEQAPAVAVIREITAALLYSLRDTLGYFANSRQNDPFAGVVLSGGGAQLLGLADAFSEVARIPVVLGDTFGNIDVAKDASRGAGSQAGLNVALGLALGGAAA
ncbi:type IV pilus assembly protein PilM [Salinibacterium sp. G-O1]|uniref:type IV pilus assembly protein PilM n=1 Tax=Salinibacterium sp. G-O1 TaxID=3046208 RepID=UPI0024B8F686|nr:type IV pilus assembly protein PilM [Salinibacterium sp. G-O1]MDJ0334131.1 type IV pilus assembly protein PilM [Salinibacterium sp. G-O1]